MPCGREVVPGEEAQGLVVAPPHVERMPTDLDEDPPQPWSIDLQDALDEMERLERGERVDTEVEGAALQAVARQDVVEDHGIDLPIHRTRPHEHGIELIAVIREVGELVRRGEPEEWRQSHAQKPAHHCERRHEENREQDPTQDQRLRSLRGVCGRNEIDERRSAIHRLTTQRAYGFTMPIRPARSPC
jgi:hypothetical protein